MRVTHIIAGIDAALGGPVAALVGLARAQAMAGMDVTVAPAVPSPQLPPTADLLRQAGAQVVPVICSHSPFGFHDATRAQLLPILEQSDVVHIYGLWESIQHETAALCRKLDKPHIFEPCGMLDQWAMRRSRLKKNLYMMLRLRNNLNRSTAIHVSTTWERDQTAPLNLKPPLVVVPAGVDLSEFNELPARGEFRRKYPELQGKPLITFLGRVFRGKGVEMLIPALAQMKNRSAMLAVVGPDSNGYVSQMRAKVSELKLDERVIFTGMARGRERIEALVDADVFSLPSEHENFGVAVLEAMAAGVPVVVSDQVGLCHDIVQAQAGEAVPLDADRLAEALDRWLEDADMRRRAGERARALAFERFTWDLIARRWSEVYKDLSI